MSLTQHLLPGTKGVQQRLQQGLKPLAVQAPGGMGVAELAKGGHYCRRRGQQCLRRGRQFPARHHATWIGKPARILRC